MDEGNDREVARYRFGIRGTLYSPRGSVGMNVTVREISTLGCELDEVEGPSVGSKCELYFDWRGIRMGFVARVVWKDAEGRLDLKFLSVDTESQKRLQELCGALRTQQAPTSPPKGWDAGRPIPKSAEDREAAHPAALAEALRSPPRKLVMERRYRQLPRYVSELPAYFPNPATGVTSSGTLVNISIAGGRFEGLGLPEAGQNFEFQTEWNDKRVLLRGVVVWKLKEHAGVKFSPLDEGTENLLRRICSDLRLEPSLRPG